MTTRHTATPAGDFARSAAQVVHHLGRQHPGVRWAVSRSVAGRHELVAVHDPSGTLQVGDVVAASAEDAHATPRRLVGPAGEELGALWAVTSGPSRSVTAPDALADPAVGLLVDLLTVILDADLARVASARRSQLLHEQALSDELTGLLNRRGWTQVLEVEAPYTDPDDAPSVIVLDLDRLKEVNDVQGHVAGDEYLQLAAVTLSAACREDDLVARLGGDEFGVLVQPSGPDAAGRLVARIRTALDAAGVAASIGRAHYDPDGGLVRTWWRADRAMYAEKQRRRRQLASAVVLG